MADERNALAELAGRLETHIIPISGSVGSRAVGMRIADDIRKARLIIAELANVKDTNWAGGHNCPDPNSASVAVSNCREIA